MSSLTGVAFIAKYNINAIVSYLRTLMNVIDAILLVSCVAVFLTGSASFQRANCRTTIRTIISPVGNIEIIFLHLSARRSREASNLILITLNILRFLQIYFFFYC